MKTSFISVLISLVFILSSYDAQALLTTTASSTPSPPTTLTKAELAHFLGRKLKAKEKLGLWILNRKLKKAQRRNPTLLVDYQELSDTSKCSTIVFKTGVEIQAHLLEILDSSVNFIRCGRSDTMSISKYDIEKITLYDGIKIYQNDFKNNSKKTRRKRKSSDKLGYASIFFGFAAIPFLAISYPLAIIFALIALIYGISGMNAAYTKHKEFSVFGAIIGMLAFVINKLRKNNGSYN